MLCHAEKKSDRATSSSSLEIRQVVNKPPDWPNFSFPLEKQTDCLSTHISCQTTCPYSVATTDLSN